ncbi:MAG: helix-turn-helix domain-containing protein [Streptococcaceae bacterium]|jgi:phage repressor protein C with HTH and peptisase S24 domain|nr:helix-turn-helix domain-containing protein [Streptococcaceae bacterium]
MFSPQKLTEQREALHLSKYALAKKLDISYASYFAWEKGSKQPNQKNLYKLAEILHVNLLYFEEGSEILTNYLQLTKDRQQKSINFVTKELAEQRQGLHLISEPTYAYHVYQKLSAGVGLSYDETERDYDTVYYNKEIHHEMASWISGDSMEPRYHDGDVALLAFASFDDGQVYAIDWDGNTYIKKVYQEKEGLRLVSLNPKYSDKFAPYEEDVRIVGKVIASFTPLEESHGPL